MAISRILRTRRMLKAAVLQYSY